MWTKVTVVVIVVIVLVITIVDNFVYFHILEVKLIHMCVLKWTSVSRSATTYHLSTIYSRYHRWKESQSGKYWSIEDVRPAQTTQFTVKWDCLCRHILCMCEKSSFALPPLLTCFGWTTILPLSLSHSLIVDVVDQANIWWPAFWLLKHSCDVLLNCLWATSTNTSM